MHNWSKSMDSIYYESTYSVSPVFLYVYPSTVWLVSYRQNSPHLHIFNRWIFFLLGFLRSFVKRQFSFFLPEPADTPQGPSSCTGEAVAANRAGGVAKFTAPPSHQLRWEGSIPPRSVPFIFFNAGVPSPWSDWCLLSSLLARWTQIGALHWSSELRHLQPAVQPIINANHSCAQYLVLLLPPTEGLHSVSCNSALK